MTQVKQIDIKAIFESQTGHPIPKPKPYISPSASNLPPNLAK
jgi:hypothetical protein